MTGDDLLQRVRVHGVVPTHVAIIMDGNGRWAAERSLPRPLGHHAGMTPVREVVEGCLAGRGRGAHPVRLQPGELAAPRGRDRGAHGPAGGVHRPGGARAAGAGRGGPHPGRHGPAAPAARGRGGSYRGGDRGRQPSWRSTSASPTAPAPRSCAPRGCSRRTWPPAGWIPPRSTRRRSRGGSTPRRGPIPISSSAPRARCGSPTSSSGSWPTPSCTSRPVLWPDFTRRHLFEAILEFQRRDRRFGRVPA